jgi:cellulose synthase operon protein C
MPVALAQTRRVQQPALQQAERAILEGRYDEVPRLLTSLDRNDPHIAGIQGRALIARGKYAEAEALLRPVAERAPVSDAGLELGLLLSMLGRPEATGLLTRIADSAGRVTDPVELARAARALRALGRALDANDVYRDAADGARDNPAIQTAWGDLFLEKFKPGEAMKSYQDALKVDPRYTPALLGSARALSDQNPPEAIKLAQKVLEINPSSVDAHVFLAEEAADAGRRDDARKTLQLALNVNPSSLAAHSLLAGLAFVEDKKEEQAAAIAKVLAINPRYGEVYRIIAEMASHNFRYEDATAFTREALTLDRRNPQILADMGLHLLRTGDEAEARRMLEEAFNLDNLNLVTYNLLAMLDKIDTFETIRDERFIIKMDKAEAPVVGDFAMSLAHEAMNTLEKRYQFTPKGPLLIEVFPKHDDFAVRIGGLPGMLGALGVCFGRVVAMDSPKAAPPGTFQWEATLWHELAHVVTLQMSNYRVPRWLTEGISVYEETLQRREWGRGMDEQFAVMLNTGETLKLVDLNAAFTDPRKISLAYYQAYLLVGHIVATYGDEGLHKLLKAYATGVDTDGALKQALNTTLADMQTGFDKTIEARFAKLKVALKPAEEKMDFEKMSVDEVRAYAGLHKDSFGAHMVLGMKLREAKQIDEAIKAFERAAELVPIAGGDDGPNAMIAEMAIEKKDNARALTALEAWVREDFDNVEAARKLAALMREMNVTDPARLRPAYQRIVAIDPFDAEAQAQVGRLSMALNQPQLAVRHFKAVIGLKPVDAASAHTDLAESQLKSGQRADARRQTLAALEIAPGYERAQNLLLEIAGSRP